MSRTTENRIPGHLLIDPIGQSDLAFRFGAVLFCFVWFAILIHPLAHADEAGLDHFCPFCLTVSAAVPPPAHTVSPELWIVSDLFPIPTNPFIVPSEILLAEPITRGPPR
ncbi:MAG: hypothetical protein ABIH23_25260 [bacterium]